MPTSESQENITLLLEKWREGDEEAFETLIASVYDELRLIARRYLRNERPGHSFKSTDLVHEAYLRLVKQERVEWRSRSHFYAIAATFMRRILVDHARKRLARKRKAEGQKVTFISNITPGDEVDLLYVVDVDQALARLANDHPRRARVAELKLFVEMTYEEMATVLEVAPATVKRDWRAARNFLAHELSNESEPAERQ